MYENDLIKSTCQLLCCTWKNNSL